ncbi:hypothetical protein ABL78_1428 [Leptomonas seymouri]|uniref:Arf-GAP domain-containing protein n=1 Tax=Leptomonas seymouri TaxID=5684 RepID=A0A0N1PDT1_LEPSE|nr:hypothetical protein ABL78_1428 [Leptomonas seymouri]|eukprot:KPI89464.1 hypothetical protein ABL78_1428 [Leptomonas seymouri]
MPVWAHHHHGSEPTRPASGATIHSSSTRSSGVSAEQLQRFEVLLRRPENRECFDCGAKQPRWASTNLGIFFCLRCAGIHRSLGTHISKVKSTNMDAWGESMLQIMEHIGNTRGRLLYEYNMPSNARVTGSTEVSVLERALRAKYEKKTYYNPQFEELYAAFMATAIEGVGSSADSSQQANSSDSGVLPSLPQANPPVRRATYSQPPPQEPLDELWGAPVSSSSAAEEGRNTTAGGKHNHNVTSVAELFSDSYPAGVVAGQRSNTVWGPNPRLNNNTNDRAVNGLAVAHPSSSSVANSDWFDSNFGGSNGNLCVSGAPSPATPHSPQTAVSSRNNTDDLFQGSGHTPTAEHNKGSKEEILSLFASASVVGAGERPSGGHGSPNNGYPMAWQPQVVKPYYHPS